MKFRKEVLRNGIRLLSCHLPKRKTVCAQVAVGAGTRNEWRRYKGLAHFVEHMAFKGSRNFPSPVAIAKAFVSTGADFNAYTDRDITSYEIFSSPSGIDRALEIVLDIFFYPRYRTNELKLERGVVLAEHRDYLDDPTDVLDNLQSQLIYGANHPLGWPVVGNSRSIPEITIRNLLNFHHHYYRQTNNIVVSVAGNFSGATLRKLRKYLNGIPQNTFHLPKAKYRSRQTKPRLAVKYWDGKQVYFNLGFRAYPHRHPKMAALTVLDAVLASGWGSPLSLELRDKRGLIYGFDTGIYQWKECGTYEISSSLHRKDLKTALKVVLAELRKLREDLVSADDLDRVHKIFDEYLNYFTSSYDFCDWMLNEELFEGEIKTPQEWMGELKAVTPKEIREVARELFQDSGINLAVVGSHANSYKHSLKDILTVGDN